MKFFWRRRVRRSADVDEITLTPRQQKVVEQLSRCVERVQTSVNRRSPRARLVAFVLFCGCFGAFCCLCVLRPMVPSLHVVPGVQVVLPHHEAGPQGIHYQRALDRALFPPSASNAWQHLMDSLGATPGGRHYLDSLLALAPAAGQLNQ